MPSWPSSKYSRHIFINIGMGKTYYDHLKYMFVSANLFLCESILESKYTIDIFLHICWKMFCQAYLLRSPHCITVHLITVVQLNGNNYCIFLCWFFFFAMGDGYIKYRTILSVGFLYIFFRMLEIPIFALRVICFPTNSQLFIYVFYVAFFCNVFVFDVIYSSAYVNWPQEFYFGCISIAFLV